MYQRLNGKGTAIVTRGRRRARTSSADRSVQWGFNSHQAKNPHFGSSEKPYRGSIGKDRDCPGVKWEQHYNGSNQYRFTRTFIDGEALRIFDLKSTELRHENVANLILVMNHVVTYFGPE